jgi:hypothetical protein
LRRANGPSTNILKDYKPEITVPQISQQMSSLKMIRKGFAATGKQFNIDPHRLLAAARYLPHQVGQVIVVCQAISNEKHAKTGRILCNVSSRAYCCCA